MNMSQSLTRHLKSSREKLILSLSSELRVLLLTITKFFYLPLTRMEKRILPSRPYKHRMPQKLNRKFGVSVALQKYTGISIARWEKVQ